MFDSLGQAFVSRSSSAFISPNPLKRVTVIPFSPAARIAGSNPRRSSTPVSFSPFVSVYRDTSIPVRSWENRLSISKPSSDRSFNPVFDRFHFAEFVNLNSVLINCLTTVVRYGFISGKLTACLLFNLLDELVHFLTCRKPVFLPVRQNTL